MPYIKQELREGIDEAFKEFLFKFSDDESSLEGQITEGELNYLIAKILLSTNPRGYSDYNGLIGVLECCKLEFYRRAVASYEDKKKEENGDVY